MAHQVEASAGLGAQSKLFVGGISSQTSTEVLYNHFSKYGHLTDAIVMTKNGRARGFGFVTFVSELAAAQALAEPQEIDGRLVDVKRAVPGESAQERPSNKIFVGGLPQDVTTEKLRAYFASYGAVADAVVMVDRQTKRSRGFGFIRFAHGRHGSAAAQAVLRDFQHHWLEGKWVDVKPATPASTLEEMAACFLETSAQSSGTVGATSSGSRNRQAAERWTAYHPSAASVGQKGHPAEGLAQDLADPWPHAMDVAGPAPFAGDLQWVMPQLPTILAGVPRPSVLGKGMPARAPNWPLQGHLSSPMKVTCRGVEEVCSAGLRGQV